jgi:hypothetical protein
MSLPETEIDDLPKEIKALPEEMKAQYRSWAGYVLPDGRKFQDLITVESVQIKNETITGSVFQNQQLVIGSFKQSNVRRFCFQDENLDLTNADLNKIDLCGFNLKRANLKNARFSGANFSGADLSGVSNLLNGYSDSGTDYDNINVLLSPTTILPLEVLKLHYQADCHNYVCANNDDYSSFFLFCSMVLEEALENNQPYVALGPTHNHAWFIIPINDFPSWYEHTWDQIFHSQHDRPWSPPDPEKIAQNHNEGRRELEQIIAVLKKKIVIYPSLADPLSHPELQKLPDSKRLITSELYAADSWAGPPILDDLPFLLLPHMVQAIEAMMPFLDDEERLCVIAGYRMPEVQRRLHETNKKIAGLASPHCAGVAIAGCVTREASPERAAGHFKAIVNNHFSGGGSPNLQSEDGWNFLRFQSIATNSGLVFPYQEVKPWHAEDPNADQFPQIHFPNAQRYLLRSR